MAGAVNPVVKFETSIVRNMTLVVVDMDGPTMSSVNERKKSMAKGGRCFNGHKFRTKWRYSQGASTRLDETRNFLSSTLMPYLHVSILCLLCCSRTPVCFFGSRLLAPGATTMRGSGRLLSTRGGSWSRTHCPDGLPRHRLSPCRD